ncbi:MAG: cytochrome c biogenesis protein ResB [Tepidiformaceae bacterium]
MSARTAATSSAPAQGGFDPLRLAWNLLTNVKFALLLVGTALALSMVGVVIPQLPGPMRQNAAARSAWLELRREDYGAFTGPMERLGLFDVFRSAWFNGLWVLIIVAVTVCAVSRFLPTARSVHRPPRAVPERYFETAHHRASFSHAGGAEALERALRRRRYRVERTHEAGGATYLFAERFAWSHYGTFLSHLALLMLLVGGLLTSLAGFDRTLVIAETTPAVRVFSDPGPGQLFVTMVDAYRGKDERGNIIDYHSIIEVRRGQETKLCKTTVNDPCHAFGYKVHQAAFFDDIGRLRIVNSEGRVLYDDVLDFDSQQTVVPHMKVTDAGGRVLFDQVVPQMGTFPGQKAGPEDDIALAAVSCRTAAAGEPAAFAIGWRIAEGALRVFVQAGAGPRDLPPGQPLDEGAVRIEYVRPEAIPATTVDDMPGAGDGRAVIQMPLDGAGEPYLFVTGIAAENVVLRAGDAPYASEQGFTYSFGGRLEASGVSVRRDPGDTFIWVAVAMAIVGLAITFYVPRRRLWLKVTPEKTYIAGIAEKTTRLGRELRFMGAELGAQDALLPGDRTGD